MNLLDLLLAYLISFLRWAFTITGRYSVARQQWEYGRYRSALAALSTYLFHVANAMAMHKRWLEYTHREMAREKQEHLSRLQRDAALYGFTVVNIDGTRIDPTALPGMEMQREFMRRMENG